MLRGVYQETLSENTERSSIPRMRILCAMRWKLIIKAKSEARSGGSSAGMQQRINTSFPIIFSPITMANLNLTLNSRNAPDLRISRSYTRICLKPTIRVIKKTKNLKEAVTFVKQKLDAAKWFIDAIKQRQQTLLEKP